MDTFDLPTEIADLVTARNRLRALYDTRLRELGSEARLKFTLDGNLVGDIGEAIAVEMYGIRLVTTKSTEGFDGYAPRDHRTVQVKATGVGGGPAFRQTQVRADHLLFFDINFATCQATVIYNGPEAPIVQKLPSLFKGQRQVSAKRIRDANLVVRDEDRLHRIR